jgi:hypothetical protein
LAARQRHHRIRLVECRQPVNVNSIEPLYDQSTQILRLGRSPSCSFTHGLIVPGRSDNSACSRGVADGEQRA